MSLVHLSGSLRMESNVYESIIMMTPISNNEIIAMKFPKTSDLFSKHFVIPNIAKVNTEAIRKAKGK